MNIAKDHVVHFHYTVSDVHGGEVESSRGREPIATLVGHGGIIPGLENALMGRSVGDAFEVEVTPDEAYGPRREGQTQRLPKKHFKGAKLLPGMQVVVPTTFGPRPVTILKVGLSTVDVDLNHPMAGKSLRFAIEITGVREASDEEKSHGHVHGEGGVQH